MRTDELEALRTRDAAGQQEQHQQHRQVSSGHPLYALPECLAKNRWLVDPASYRSRASYLAAPKTENMRSGKNKASLSSWHDLSQAVLDWCPANPFLFLAQEPSVPNCVDTKRASMVTSPSAPTLSSSVSGTGNPLVASYSLTAPDQSQVKIQFGLTTDYGLETWLVPAPSGGGTVTILVAGMLQSSTYHMRAVVQLANSITIFDVDQTFQTGAIPADIPMPKFQVTASDTPPCAGVELVNLNPNNPVVTDLQGDIIWYYFNATDQAHKCHPMPLKPLTNGNMLVSCTNRYDGAKTPYCVLREVDLASKTVSGPNGPRELLMEDLNQRLENIKTPFGRTVQVNYYSHDVLPLSNGHVILLCQEFVNVNVGGTEILVWGDALVDLDDSYNPVWVWSAFDVLDINRHPFEWSPGAYDWTHCNAVQYTPDGNLFALRAKPELGPQTRLCQWVRQRQNSMDPWF